MADPGDREVLRLIRPLHCGCLCCPCGLQEVGSELWGCKEATALGGGKQVDLDGAGLGERCGS